MLKNRKDMQLVCCFCKKEGFIFIHPWHMKVTFSDQKNANSHTFFRHKSHKKIFTNQTFLGSSIHPLRRPRADSLSLGYKTRQLPPQQTGSRSCTHFVTSIDQMSHYWKLLWLLLRASSSKSGCLTFFVRFHSSALGFDHLKEQRQDRKLNLYTAKVIERDFEVSKESSNGHFRGPQKLDLEGVSKGHKVVPKAPR